MYVFWASLKAKDRKSWMNSIAPGISQSLALAKQKCKLLEKASEGQIRMIEQKILEAVSFPGVLGQFTVELSADISQYRAVFDTGSEKIEKIWPTLGKVHTWLLSMTFAFKKGDIQRQNRSVEVSSKPQVALEKALTGLDAPVDLPTAMKGIEPDALCSAEKNEDTITDVTTDILNVSKPFVVPMKSATINVHRGSFNSFMKLAAADTSKQLGGILLGRFVWNQKFHVTQMVLTTEPLETLLKDDKIKAVCDGVQLTPCGFIVKGSAEEWCEKVLDSFNHFPHCDYPLIICADFSSKITGDVSCWELDSSVEQDISVSLPTCTRVSLSWTTQPHDQKRRLNYNVCWLKDFNCSHIEKATHSICQAVVSHVCSGLVASTPNVDTVAQRDIPKQKFQLIAIPADGRCGWYSLLAGTDTDRFLSIPRDECGYPKNRSLHKAEIPNAKELHSLTCEDALTNCDPKYHASVRRVLRNPSFDPIDLAWISSGKDFYPLLLLPRGEPYTLGNITLRTPTFSKIYIYIYRYI